MSPLFKCLSCGQNIERSTKTFWKKKGHILCSTCQDKIEKEKKVAEKEEAEKAEATPPSKKN